jgi:uridine kinase
MQEIDSIKQSNLTSNTVLVGVAGGSGSGKTYFAEALVNTLGKDICQVICQDNFYFDQSDRFDFDGGSVNFDHPDSIDFACLANCLASLKQGKATEIPQYDFATHSRRAETQKIYPKSVVVVDGILIFHSEPVRALFDELIFFDTPEELRFDRRLKRDVSERGRSPDGVLKQYTAQVKPMHDQFVEPSKSHADFVVVTEQDFADALMRLTAAPKQMRRRTSRE